MRTLLAAALLFVSSVVAADDATKPALSIELQPLGDSGHGVVTQLFFRFANPRAVTDAGLFLEGSLRQGGGVPRNFRFAVPRKGDKMIWHNTVQKNGKITRHTAWSALPDQRNQMAMVHTFAEGEAEVQVWLVLETDDGSGPQLIAEAAQTFTLAKTNRPFEVAADEGEPAVTEDAVPEETGAVTIRPPRRSAVSSLSAVSVDVLPPVKRVEFWIEDKRALARNTPPYTAEFDLSSSERVVLRAVGYDKAGLYVDADAFVVNESETHIGVKITRTITSDGLSHFKLTVRNPQRSRLERVVLYAGDKKLHEWSEPPYALSVPTASLEGADFVRASVIDESGYEAGDRQLLHVRQH